MDNDPLRDLCVTWPKNGEGAVSLLMLPFTTIKANAFQKAFSELVPQAQWSFIENSFVIFNIYVVDVLEIDQESAIARALQKAWDIRNLPIAERWEFWQIIYSDVLGEVVGRAYVESQDHTFDGPIALKRKPGEGASGEASSVTKRRSKAS